eukprot:1149801-Pelagomonas_calceolata.AAC.3
MNSYYTGHALYFQGASDGEEGCGRMAVESRRRRVRASRSMPTTLQSVVQGNSAAPLPSVGIVATSLLHQQERALGEGQKKKSVVPAIMCYAVSKASKALPKQLDHLVTMCCGQANCPAKGVAWPGIVDATPLLPYCCW